jgi:hypothetical protein
MNRRTNQGFTLVEFILAIVFIGVVVGPLLLFVARIHDLNNAIGQQARVEAWRSFGDQALVAGIDPSRAPALTTALNASIPATSMPSITEEPTPSVAGVARIVPLRMSTADSVAESRLAGAGFQIGAGGAVAARATPTPPLLPVVMPVPAITPADGTVVAPISLALGQPGDPATLTIQAASITGVRVALVLNQPHASTVGLGNAQQSVTAIDLLQRVNGTAWSEYAGNSNQGDQAVVLGDGRTRWLVTRTDGRLQIYEPSANAAFAYTIGLGSPVVDIGSAEYGPGASIAVDYATYVSVQSGANIARIEFPAAIAAVFGSKWAEQSIGYQWTFHDSAGPFSGDIRPFFASDTLSLWADSVTIAATPIVPAGAVADPATWTFARTKTALGVPVLASAADATGFHAPGQMEFRAPNGPDGTAIGRLSFENGANLSTGSTLAIAVIP